MFSLFQILDSSSASVDFSSFISSLTGSITTVQLLAILTNILAVVMAFFFMWFSVRKIFTIFTSLISGHGFRGLSSSGSSSSVDFSSYIPEYVPDASDQLDETDQSWEDYDEDVAEYYRYF